MKKVRIIIIVIGLALSIYTSVTFFTKKKVVEIGKVEITRDKPHHLNWSPLMGVALMVIGAGVWKFSKK
jgi:hypothetical protein